MMRKFAAQCTVPGDAADGASLRCRWRKPQKKHHTVRRATAATEEADDPAPLSSATPAAFPTPVPGQREENGAPKTRAAAVLVTDVRSGQVLYEKNADAPRAAASTQKLLTALIVAEAGFLDRPVTVEQIDTLAEPVRLNIKPGEVYPADRSAPRAPGEKP